MDMLTILREAVEHHASDIHLAVGRAPLARIQGEIVQFEGPPLDAQGAKNMLYSLLSKDQVKAFEENMELDFCYSVPGLARFRINIFLQKDGIAAAIRVIKGVIPGPEEILLPREVIKLCELPRGLILVAGPTGSGKSTTLACMLNYINHHRRQHILTIEDPIEFVYDQGHCLVTQREVGRQTHSFANALRSAMRQDPDV
ncbi:MAG TPA: ATPase, T2SS/T4P/T4SS family, partial [Candidatus Nitrosotenuis sp.]|nr:ATPase, T2SS/T4P/T4SS family [Candidatus Nitrosotenuis sp.]